jgi:nucleoside-diphosphate-sugar epimerase
MNKASLAQKRVLVTGGAGVIGQELVTLLQSQGATVRVVDFAEKPHSFQSVEYLRLDLAQKDSQFLFRFEPQVVFHLAADFERSTENLIFWETNFKNNILASHNLLEQIRHQPSLERLVFASSYLIYDKDQYNRVDRDGVLSESSKVDPRNLCGVAKLQTERDIEFLQHQPGIQFTSVSARIFRVYGKGSRDIVSRWVRSAIARQTLTVFGKQNKFDYIFAGDVAKGLLELASAPAAQGVVNLGTGISRSVDELSRLVCERVSPVPITETDDEIYPESSRADIAKLREWTGWSPTTTLEQGIEILKAYELQAR